MAERLSRLRHGSITLAWFLLVVLLPLTSSPLLAGLAGASTVAPLSALPLLWLAVIWFLPYLLRRGALSAVTVPLIGFALAALASSAYAFFLDVPYYRGKTLLSQEVPAILTLGVGLAFYLVIATWASTEDRLNHTFRLLNLGGLVLIVWSFAQAFVVLFLDGAFPDWMARVQDWASVRGVFAVRVSGFPRLTGFAYEPSWLAHQLNLVYLPYWLAASVKGFTAHGRRLWRISLENILLVSGVVVLVFSFSRVGLLALALVVTFTILKVYQGWVKRLVQRLADRLQLAPAKSSLIGIGISTGLLALFLVIYLAGMVGLVYGLSRYDSRLESLFDAQTFQVDSLYTLTNQLGFAERAVYWATGWEIFNDHPFLGVGLGNAGFFFPEKMPAYGWGLWETARIFFQRSFLPNTKSMWVRILTETGLLGFAFFAAWLFMIWTGAHHAQSSAKRLITTSALAGQLALVSFAVEGFSIDSFALPYLWVAAGMLTAAIRIFQKDAPPIPPQPDLMTG